MNIIDEFIEHYKKEYDFYDTASKLVAQQLENALHTSGIRAIVTYRAKILNVSILNLSKETSNIIIHA